MSEEKKKSGAEKAVAKAEAKALAKLEAAVRAYWPLRVALCAMDSTTRGGPDAAIDAIVEKLLQETT